MSQHYQERHKCIGCGRELIVDITSIGVPHQMVVGVTCTKCAKKLGGHIMKEGEIEEPKEIEY